MQPIPGVSLHYLNGPQIPLGPFYDTYWAFLATGSQAAQAKSLFSSLIKDPEVYDAGAGRVTLSLPEGADPTIKCWNVKGTVTDPRFLDPIPVDEECGSIIDRWSNPRQGIDMIDKTSKVTPYLKVEVYPGGYAEVIWTNYL